MGTVGAVCKKCLLARRGGTWTVYDLSWGGFYYFIDRFRLVEHEALCKASGLVLWFLDVIVVYQPNGRRNLFLQYS